MSIRTNFNYKKASVHEVVEQFKLSTRQAIYAIRRNWKDDEQMHKKIEEAFYLYKLAEFNAKFPSDITLQG